MSVWDWGDSSVGEPQDPYRKGKGGRGGEEMREEERIERKERGEGEGRGGSRCTLVILH